MAQVARPLRIQEIQQASQELFALLAGMQLDLFTPLGDGPLCSDELAVALGVDAEKLSLLLYALVVAGLLTVEGECFANTDETAQFLVRGKTTYMGSAHTLWSEFGYAGLKVAESVRTGIPQARHNYGEMSEDELLVTLGGLHAAALRKGRALAARYNFGPNGDILDVAGGTGGTSIALVEVCADLHATIAELPGILPLTRRYVAEAGMSDRIDTVAIDVLHDAVPGQFDAAVVSTFVQVLSAEEARVALVNVGRSIRPGGAVYVIGSILDDSRLTPARAAQLNVIFLSCYDCGQSYTEAEYRSWLTDAGFVDITREEEINGVGLIRARKDGRACASDDSSKQA